MEIQGWIEFQRAMNLVANEVGSLLIARKKRVDALVAGKITSAATKKVRHPKTGEILFEHDYLLKASWWDINHHLKTMHDLIDLEDAAEAQSDNPSDARFVEPPPVSTPEDMRLWVADFVAVFPKAGQATLTVGDGPPKPRDHLSIVPEAHNKGGRPQKWDWEGALIEMARVAVLADDCDREALAAAVEEWFVKNTGDHPAPSEIRKRVKRLHENIWPPKT